MVRIFFGVVCVLFVSLPLSVFAAPIVADSFSTTWSTGDSTQVQINLGTCPTSVYWESLADEGINGTNFTCDGSFNTIVNFGDGGDYRVDFSGAFTTIDLGDQSNRDKFRTVEQWGDSVWQNFSYAFYSVKSLVFNASDVPNLSQVTDMNYLFDGASNFDSDISGWDVSNVTSMLNTFSNASSFNQPLDSWDVSNVDTMAGMFGGASSFNQPLGSWNTTNVTNMSSMFRSAVSFNQPLDSWDVSNVVHMGAMFNDASSFNQPLDSWDVSSVSNFGCFGDCYSGMFKGATVFNQSLGDWPVSSGASMYNIVTDSGIDRDNYTATLIGWAGRNLLPSEGQENIGDIPAMYCESAQDARDVLARNGWIFNDLGPVSCDDEVSADNQHNSTATRVGDRQKRLEALAREAGLRIEAEVAEVHSSVDELLALLGVSRTVIEAASPLEKEQIIRTLQWILDFLTSYYPALIPEAAG